MENEERTCRWVELREALAHFATSTDRTQSQQHIKPLHWYVACRLVLEGGFRPEDVTPRPPFISQLGREGRWYLQYDRSVATGAERTLLGGLKTKDVDVVVSLDGIGPAVAISLKGMTGALRNLTNRMEEAVGDCTNLHITYPALVAAYVMVIRANRALESALADTALGAEPARQLRANDVAISEGGEPVEMVLRFHAALRELDRRAGIRDDVSRYEAAALAMIETGADAGAIMPDFPPAHGSLRIENVFDAVYLRYDERFVYAAPELKAVTQRRSWDQTSPAFAFVRPESFACRLDAD